jgi:hypothetical protein
MVFRIRLVLQGIEPLLSPRRSLLDQDDGQRRQRHNYGTEKRKRPPFSYRSHHWIYDRRCASGEEASREIELQGSKRSSVCERPEFWRLTEAVMAPPVPGKRSTIRTEVIPIVICNPPPTGNGIRHLSSNTLEGLTKKVAYDGDSYARP